MVVSATTIKKGVAPTQAIFNFKIHLLFEDSNKTLGILSSLIPKVMIYGTHMEGPWYSTLRSKTTVDSKVSSETLHLQFNPSELRTGLLDVRKDLLFPRKRR